MTGSQAKEAISKMSLESAAIDRDGACHWISPSGRCRSLSREPPFSEKLGPYTLVPIFKDKKMVSEKAKRKRPDFYEGQDLWVCDNATTGPRKVKCICVVKDDQNRPSTVVVSYMGMTQFANACDCFDSEIDAWMEAYMMAIDRAGVLMKAACSHAEVFRKLRDGGSG